MFVLAKKLIHLKCKLLHWEKVNFGSIKLKKLTLLNIIEALDITKETRRLTPEETVQDAELCIALGTLL